MTVRVTYRQEANAEAIRKILQDYGMIVSDERKIIRASCRLLNSAYAAVHQCRLLYGVSAKIEEFEDFNPPPDLSLFTK